MTAAQNLTQFFQMNKDLASMAGGHRQVSNKKAHPLAVEKMELRSLVACQKIEVAKLKRLLANTNFATELNHHFNNEFIKDTQSTIARQKIAIRLCHEAINMSNEIFRMEDKFKMLFLIPELMMKVQEELDEMIKLYKNKVLVKEAFIASL